MKRTPFYIIIGIIVIGAGFYGIARMRRTAKTTEIPHKPRIVTSFYPLYFFTKSIVGDMADVYNVTPAGGEPHDYEPTPQDIEQIDTSSLIIINGDLEPWADKVKDDAAQKNIPLIAVGQGLVSQEYTDENGASAKDPHVWLDPTLASQIAQKIADAMIRIDPARATSYRDNVALLQKKLHEVDARYRDGLAHCAQHAFVTSHAAFGYLAKEYGLKQIAIAGLSPDAEPSARNMAAIIQAVRAEHIPYIFFESLASPKLSETIAEETGTHTLVLNPLEGITPQEASQGKDYMGEMEANLANLRLALACN